MPTKKKTLAKLNSFLNANSPKLAFFLHHIWRNQQQAVTYKELREAIQRGEFDMSYMLQWQQDYSVFVNTYYAAVAQKAIDTATQALRAQYPVLEDAMPSLMDNFIQTQGGRLIREVTTSQYTAINTLVRQAALSDTMTGDQLARAIRPCIGLTQRQAQSVFHLHNDLIDQGIDAATAQKRAEHYAEMVHRRRSALIAQTELAYAYNNGQQALIEEAIKNGTIAPDVTKVWYTAADERVCESCGKLDMQEIPWDATFSNGKITAPAHPNCRCAVAYTKLKALAPQPKTQARTPTQTSMQPSVQTETQTTHVATRNRNPFHRGPLIHTGGRIERNDWSEKHEKAAIRIYNKIRSRAPFVDAEIIVQHVPGFTAEEIEEIRQHVFIREHELDDGLQRFDEDFDQAKLWERLLVGTDLLKSDITFLKHELEELTIMRKMGYNYKKAHELANQKYPWWDEFEKETK